MELVSGWEGGFLIVLAAYRASLMEVERAWMDCTGQTRHDFFWTGWR